MKTVVVILALLVASPAHAGSLNDWFTFADLTHVQTGERHDWHGTGGQYLGMGDLTLDFAYAPDPFGHPSPRNWNVSGTIPELGITEPDWIFFGVVLDDATAVPGGLEFWMVADLVHDGIPGYGEAFTWTVALEGPAPEVARLAVVPVPAPATAVLLLVGVLLAGGCAPTWVRRGSPPTALEADQYLCEMEAERVTPAPTGPYGGLIYVLMVSSWLRQKATVTRECMRLRGWQEAAK